jgi:hypothetical protein
VRFLAVLALGLVGAAVATAKPPPAWIDTSAGWRPLAQSSYCWTEQGRGICADFAAPRCGDGRTPRIPVRLGETVRFRLGFAPRSISLQFFGGAGVGDYRLATRRVVAWRVQRLGAFALFATARQRGDSSYVGCLVARS